MHELNLQIKKLNTKVVSWSRMNEFHALKVLLVDTIHYKEPALYRSKMPAYATQKNTMNNNLKIVKKIIKVKQNNEDGVQSVGGASGIS